VTFLSSSEPLLKHFLVGDKAISNEFITLVFTKVYGALANFTERAGDEESLRCALTEVRLEMVSVIHKLHLFTDYWEMLSNKYATLKASLSSCYGITACYDVAESLWESDPGLCGENVGGDKGCEGMGV
jgi:hypothetical protein